LALGVIVFHARHPQPLDASYFNAKTSPLGISTGSRPGRQTADLLIDRENLDARDIDEQSQIDHRIDDAGDVFRLNGPITIVEDGLRLVVGREVRRFP
jgi:hypothetical protein